MKTARKKILNLNIYINKCSIINDIYSNTDNGFVARYARFHYSKLILETIFSTKIYLAEFYEIYIYLMFHNEKC